MLLLFIPFLATVAVASSLISDVKPMFVEVDGYSMSDKKFFGTVEASKTLSNIEVLLEKGDYISANVAIKEAKKRIRGGFSGSLLEIYTAKIIEANGSPSKAKVYLENQMSLGNIAESHLMKAYLDLMKYSLDSNNVSELKRYKKVLDETNKKDSQSTFRSELMYADYLVRKGSYNISSGILDKIITETIDKEVASDAMFLKGRIEVARGDKKGASKLLHKIYANNKEYFVKKRRFVEVNKNFLWKNSDMPIVIQIMEDLSKAGDAGKNQDAVSSSILLSKIFFSRGDYLKSIDAAMTALRTPKKLSTTEKALLTKNNDLSYLVLGMVRKEVLQKKYKDSPIMLSRLEVADYKRMIKDKKFGEMTNGLPKLKEQTSDVFDYFYEKKEPFIKGVSEKIIMIFFEEYPNIKDSENVIGPILFAGFEEYIGNKKINKNILIFLSDSKEKKFNKIIEERLRLERNLSTRQAEVELFMLEAEPNMALSVIKSVLNDNGYSMLEKRWFYTRLLEIGIIEGRPYNELREMVASLDEYGVKAPEKMDFLYKLYMLKKNTKGVLSSEKEDILYSMMNLSLRKTSGLYRPFIDLELIDIQNEEGRFVEAEILLQNVKDKDSIRRDFKIRWLTLSGIVNHALKKDSIARLALKQCIILSMDDKISLTNCKMLLKTVEGEN